MKQALAALACVIALASCSVERIGMRRDAVIEGEPSEAGPDDAVLILLATTATEATLCSATLIAPNLVITAHHCVSPMVPGRFRCNLDGTLASADLGAGTLGPEYAPETLEFYGGAPRRSKPLAVGARIHSTSSFEICLNDIALVELDRPLDLPYAPIRLDRPAEGGGRVAVVGYGLDVDPEPGSPIELDQRNQPRLRRAGLTIDAVGPDTVQDGVSDVMPRTFSVLGPSVCLGDSGGPAFAESDGGLLGVYSMQLGEQCTSPDVQNYFVHLPPFRRFILDAFAAAGAEPWRAGDPDPRLAPDGAPCADGAECQSAVCIESACAEACVDATCAAGFRCNERIGPRGICEREPHPDPVDPEEPADAGAPGMEPPAEQGSSSCALRPLQASRERGLLSVLVLGVGSAAASYCRRRARR